MKFITDHVTLRSGLAHRLAQPTDRLGYVVAQDVPTWFVTEVPSYASAHRSWSLLVSNYTSLHGQVLTRSMTPTPKTVDSLSAL